MDIKTPVHTLGVVTANGNQTSVSELKEQNIERSVQVWFWFRYHSIYLIKLTSISWFMYEI